MQTELGIENVVREEQAWKACEPIIESFDLDSNDTVSSEVHPQKHELSIVVTEFGITNDVREEQNWKAHEPITESFDLDSNDTVWSDLHSWKQ